MIELRDDSAFPADGMLIMCGLSVMVLCSVWVIVPNRDLMIRRVPWFESMWMRRVIRVAVMNDLKTRWARAALQALTSLMTLGLMRMRHGWFDRLIVIRARDLLSGITVLLNCWALVVLFSVR